MRTAGRSRDKRRPAPVHGGRNSPMARSRAAPAAPWRRSDGSYRAPAIPWTKARATRRRQVSWLAGHGLMHGLPRPCMISVRPSGCPVPSGPGRCASRSPLTVAGTAAELDGPTGSDHPHRIPFQAPCGAPARSMSGLSPGQTADTGAIVARQAPRGRWPIEEDRPRKRQIPYRREAKVSCKRPLGLSLVVLQSP